MRTRRRGGGERKEEAGPRQFCSPKFAHVGLSRGPQVQQKKPLDLTHSRFENRSRTTCPRFLQSFALPDEAVELQTQHSTTQFNSSDDTAQHTATQHSTPHTYNITRRHRDRQDKTSQDKTRLQTVGFLQRDA